MIIKYTVTVAGSGIVEQLEVGSKKFERKSTRQPFGFTSDGDYFGEQVAAAGFSDDIAGAIYDALDCPSLAMDLSDICEEMEEED